MVGIHTGLRDCAACPRPRGAHRASGLRCLPSPTGCTQGFATALPALARGVHTELRDCAACPCRRVHTELWDCTEWTGSAPQSKPTGLEETVSPSWAHQNLPVWRPSWFLLELGLIGTWRVVDRHPSPTPHEAAMGGNAQKLLEEQALRRGRDWRDVWPGPLHARQLGFTHITDSPPLFFLNRSVFLSFASNRVLKNGNDTNHGLLPIFLPQTCHLQTLAPPFL